MKQEDPTSATTNKQSTEAASPNLYRTLMGELKSTLSITGNAHPKDTIEGIIRDVDFKGFNVWILILAIFIASIGLNVNSTAVIIGAMLISPLMGPIMGVGLGMGINDWTLLKRSFRSLAVAVLVGLITSALYFSLTPLSDAQSELLARTRPNILDVFIAFFGGLAGILAGSRKEKSNVVPGVAIATALMPPLCTAGYGIGTAQWEFALGAFYLFLINSIFISIATFLVVRLLRFPLVDFSDPAKERRARRYITGFALVTIVPAIWVFLLTVKETLFLRSADQYVQEIVDHPGAEIVKTEVEYSDTLSTIQIVLMGKRVPADVIRDWKGKMSLYSLDNTRLEVIQGEEVEQAMNDDVRMMVDVFNKAQNDLLKKDTRIQLLEARLQSMEAKRIDFQKLSTSVHLQHPQMQSFDMSFRLHSDFERVDTIPYFSVQWSDEANKKECVQREQQLAAWLKFELGLDTLVLLRADAQRE